ncbi:MAG: type II toxin-antitoxin system VapC family toxin [Candidatus Saliniplasma sp.]
MSKDFPSLFIDTSAWVALNEKKDSHHQHAQSFIEKNRDDHFNFGQVHTSEMVLQETYTFLRYNYNYEAAVEIVGKIKDSNIIIHPFNSMDFKEIWGRIVEKENELSFVDWSTSVYMDKYDIRYIFTFDYDFKKLGFKVLP